MYNAYVAVTLESLKGKDIAEGFHVVRKIEKGTGLQAKACVVADVSLDEFASSLENDAILEYYKEVYQKLSDRFTLTYLIGARLGDVLPETTQTIIISMLQEREISEGRVSKDKLASWYKSDVASPLSELFKKKLGSALNTEKLNSILTVYGKLFVSLAGTATLAEQQKTNLLKALDVTPDSRLKRYCYDKLTQTLDLDIGDECNL